MKNNNQRIVTKGHYKFILSINYYLVVSIIVILYELFTKDKYFYSYILMGIAFLLKAISQFIYYKNNKTTRDIVLGVVFAIIGIVMLVLYL